jgi:hypothetical protein
MTMNRTCLESGSIETNSFRDSRSDIPHTQANIVYSQNPPAPANDIHYNALSAGLPSYFQSGSVTNVKQNGNRYRDYCTGNPPHEDFRTYISSIGLYNQHNELIMIAKLSQPMKKLITHPMIFDVKIDF